MKQINVNVAGNPEDDRPDVVADNPPGGTFLESHFEGVEGQTPNRFVAVMPDDYSGGATVYYDGNKKFRIILPPGEGSWEAGAPPCIPPEYEGDVNRVAIIYTPRTFALPTLEVRGRYFWQEGRRFFLNGASAFNAYGLYLQQGENAAREFWHQRQEFGFNAGRIWTAYNIPLIGRLVPREVKGFYQRMTEFNSLCAEYGQYPYWTCFAGANSETLGTQADMIDHRQMMDVMLAGTFALMDQHNEYDNPPNRESMFIAPNPPASVLWSQGSNSQDTDPPPPLGRFYAYHPASQSEWQRKVGKQNIDFANAHNVWLPGVDDETVRLEPGGETSLSHVHDAAQQGAFFIASAFMHSAQAKRAALFSGPELACALAWNEGVRKVHLDIAQEGQYVRHDSDDPHVLRVYEKVLGDRSQTIITYV